MKEIEVKERKSDRDQEMEITWEPGLRETTEDLVTSKLKEKERKEMTPWESYLQNKKEKKKEKRKEKETAKNKWVENLLTSIKAFRMVIPDKELPLLFLCVGRGRSQ